MGAQLDITARMEPPNESTLSSVSQRSLGSRMGNPRSSYPSRQARRSSAQVADAHDLKRRLLRRSHRLPVAPATPRLPSVVDRTPRYFRTSWRLDGTWERLGAVLREKVRAYVRAAIPDRAPASWTASR